LAVLLLMTGPLLLAVLVARFLRWIRHWSAPGRAYRAAVLASLGLTVLVRPWLEIRDVAWLPGFSLTVAGAFVGGVLTTSTSTGLVEDNARPSPGVREKVLAYHRSGRLYYPPAPRFKRALDVGVASLGLILTLPLWFLIAFAIWFEDPGPIFFTKNSVGLGGVTFRQLKFRSMRVDAERTTGPVASSAGDPRKLRCGKWLRRWHLDELPELVNVLAGTMSLVGPRPLRTVLVQGYLEALPDFAVRHSVKPGIACIAQIERYQMSPAERLRLDRVYIGRMSVGLDLMLLARAVVTTVRGTRNDA
jgi:lipopolysaccharide/colanic/teichoic acid biosynthesis glycosyltransferase